MGSQRLAQAALPQGREQLLPVMCENSYIGLQVAMNSMQQSYSCDTYSLPAEESNKGAIME